MKSNDTSYWNNCIVGLELEKILNGLHSSFLNFYSVFTAYLGHLYF